MPPARRWLRTAVGLGVAGDVLLRARPGVGLALWLVALIAAGGALARERASLERGRIVVLGLGAAAAATVAFRSAPPLHALAIGWVGISVGWALLARPWTSGLAARLGGVVVAGLSAIGLTAVGAVAEARDPGALPPGWSRRAAVAGRGALVALPILLAVGGLFMAGDPIFAHYADRVLEAGLDDVLSHLALALLLTWLAGGLVLAMAGLRVEDVRVSSERARRFAAEAVVALVLVDLLFAAFLGVQARALFGGRAFVEATAGMTYAEYARSGFFALVVAALVALPTVWGADWIVGRTPRYRRGFVGAAVGLAAGIVLVLASAAHRMALYVDAYGLTEARLYASALMVWLAIAAIGLGAAIVAGRTVRFAPGALVAAWAVFLGLVVVNPAGLVVRVNTERAATGEGPGFDVAYGTSALGTDAVPALVDAVERLPPREACRVAAFLLDDPAARSEGGWRSWTVSRWRARRAVSAHETELRAIACPEP